MRLLTDEEMDAAFNGDLSDFPRALMEAQDAKTAAAMQVKLDNEKMACDLVVLELASVLNWQPTQLPAST